MNLEKRDQRVDTVASSKRAKVLSFTAFRCNNCQRCSTQDVEIEIISVYTNTLNLRRKLCLLRCHSSEEVYLCKECYQTLSISTETLNWCFIWPSYIWKLIVDNMTPEKFNIIWRWIPSKWRLMWIEILTNDFGCRNFSSESFFHDVSSEVRQLEEDLAAMTLVKLKHALNLHPYTSVKCPWGCDEFLETCKYIPFYAFISWEFSKKYPMIKLPLSDSSIVYGEDKEFIGKKKLVGIRPDYPYTTSFMLDNPKWPIRPCLRFIKDMGPMVLVCPEHEGGSTKMYFHVPTNPITGSLPSMCNPKFAHATINSRTIQTMKLHKCSNTY